MGSIQGLVSITIPFYNAERFLRATIESVFAQSYPNWELILTDDGSTDCSSQIGRSCAAQFPNKVTYLEHPGHRNLGVNATRNLGARVSRGEFLAFLDSDDVWLPGKLETHVLSLQNTPEAGYLFGYTEYWYDIDPGEEQSQQNHIPPLAPGGKIYFPPELLAQSYPLGNYGAPCPSSFLLRRWAFESIGGFDECFNPATYQIYEDIAFMAKLYLNVPGYVSSACQERYRCHQASMSHAVESVRKEEAARRFYFRWLVDYLHEHSIRDKSIWRAVRKESWFYLFPLPVAKLLRRAIGKLSRWKLKCVNQDISPMLVP